MVRQRAHKAIFRQQEPSIWGCVGWLPGEVATTKAKDNRFRLLEVVEALGAAESILAGCDGKESPCHANSVVVESSEKTVLNIEKS